MNKVNSSHSMYKMLHIQAALLLASGLIIAKPGRADEKHIQSLAQAENSGEAVHALCRCLSGIKPRKKAVIEFLIDDKGRVSEFSVDPTPDDDATACLAEALYDARFQPQGEPAEGRDSIDLAACSLIGPSPSLQSGEAGKGWLARHRKGTRIMISGIVLLPSGFAITVGSITAHVATSFCLSADEDHECVSPSYVKWIAVTGGVMMVAGLILLFVGYDIRKTAQRSGLQALIPALAITPLTEDGGMGASLSWQL